MLAGIVAPGGNRLTFPPTTVGINVAAHIAGLTTMGPTTSRLGGNVSKNVTPVIATLLLGFLMVMVIVEIPPTGTCFGVKSLVITGGAITVSILEAGRPVPPSIEEIGPVTLL